MKCESITSSNRTKEVLDRSSPFLEASVLLGVSGAGADNFLLLTLSAIEEKITLSLSMGELCIQDYPKTD